MKKANKTKTVRTNLMSLAVVVGSVLWVGGDVGLAQDGFFPEHAYYENRFQEAYHFAFRHGFYDGLHGRRYENLANSRAESLGYDEGYRRGKAKSYRDGAVPSKNPTFEIIIH